MVVVLQIDVGRVAVCDGSLQLHCIEMHLRVFSQATT
jgi:hypothetical protein